MKQRLIALLVTALAAALLVPVAGAKPGNGNGNSNGNGNGPPAWAGGGKPDAAAKAARTAEKAARKAERRAARAPEPVADDAPKHENPAWICKFEREQMGNEAFAEEYGANENKANAFGKCVSREAHERDGVTPDGEETPAPVEPTVPGDDTGAEEPEDAASLAAVRAFFNYLWPFM